MLRELEQALYPFLTSIKTGWSRCRHVSPKTRANLGVGREWHRYVAKSRNDTSGEQLVDGILVTLLRVQTCRVEPIGSQKPA